MCDTMSLRRARDLEQQRREGDWRNRRRTMADLMLSVLLKKQLSSSSQVTVVAAWQAVAVGSNGT